MSIINSSPFNSTFARPSEKKETNGLVKGYNISIGGSLINAAISKFIEEKYNLTISIEQAENIKLEVCSLLENYNSTVEITGLNKESQVLLSDITYLLKEKLSDETKEENYYAILYLYHLLQSGYGDSG